jgi:hypothetical protein
MSLPYQTPKPNQQPFARTNLQTIAQRMALIQEFLPQLNSIAEICCGDCSRQWQAYRQQLNIEQYRALDLQPEIVAANRAQGIDCLLGDALDPVIMRQFLSCQLIFFGPPLSLDCDGHRGLSFQAITPSYTDFIQLLLDQLAYSGTLVCISPKTTTLGDARWLYSQVKALRPEFGLRLIHHSHTTLTGNGIVTEPRLKYIELWFSDQLEDRWEVRETKPADFLGESH